MPADTSPLNGIVLAHSIRIMTIDASILDIYIVLNWIAAPILDIYIGLN
jgi:hypothetical protein